VCRICRETCGNLPDGPDGMTVCERCKGYMFTQEEKIALLTKLFEGKPWLNLEPK